MVQSNIDFGENREPRVPSILLLDVSASMSGRPIDELNAGLIAYRKELAADSVTLRRVEVSVITFGNSVRTECDFCTPDAFNLSVLRAQGARPTGQAITHAIEMLDQRKETYRNNGIMFYRPWLFMITDGAPTDSWQSAAKRIRAAEAQKEFAFFGVGVENADMGILKQICVREPLKLDGLRFRDLFSWLCKAQQSVSRAKPDEEVRLTAPGWTAPASQGATGGAHQKANPSPQMGLTEAQFLQEIEQSFSDLQPGINVLLSIPELANERPREIFGRILFKMAVRLVLSGGARDAAILTKVAKIIVHFGLASPPLPIEQVEKSMLSMGNDSLAEVESFTSVMAQIDDQTGSGLVVALKVANLHTARFLFGEKPTATQSHIITKVEHELGAAAPKIMTVEGVKAEFGKLVGLERVKDDFNQLMDYLTVQKMRADKGLPRESMANHLVFYGNPGTGKTTVARLLAQLYKALGILRKGQFVEANRTTLISPIVGQTSHRVAEVVRKSLGGVLFIDEAYSLCRDENDSYGREAIDTLVKLMEDHRDDLIVIAAGYTGKMNEFLTSNEGLRSRFNKYFYFDDYEPGELLAIFAGLCAAGQYKMTVEARDGLRKIFEKLYCNRDEQFGNARDARKLFEEITQRKQPARLSRMLQSGIEPTVKELSTITLEDLPARDDLFQHDLGITSGDNSSVDQLIAQINALVGLQPIKKEVGELVDSLTFQRMRLSEGLPVEKSSRHFLFYGNPGTGKTTVARLLAKLFKGMEILRKGQLVEAGRSSLVASYAGQTAKLVTEVVSKALGGVLFIDEAYNLCTDERDAYGKEAIATLVKLMEDHRDDLIVIVAGYSRQMDEFLSINQGLKSRFSKQFYFDDYTPEELLLIFENFCQQSHYRVASDTRQALGALLTTMYSKRDDRFGNARDVRNLFEEVQGNLSKRIVRKGSKGLSREDMATITLSDLPDGSRTGTGAAESQRRYGF